MGKLTIEELIDEISLLSWEQGIEVCKVKEEHTDGRIKTCLLRGLLIEHEDGNIFGSDMDDVLIENIHALSLAGFVSDGVTITKENTLTYKLTLKSGTVITIQGLEE